MMELNLFFSKKRKRYYFTGEAKCETCEKDIDHTIIIMRSFSKLLSIVRSYCLKCTKSIKPSSYFTYEDKIVAVISKKLPSDTFPVFRNIPVLKQSNQSVYEAAIIHGSEKIMDNTKLAGRDSIEGAKIGDEKYLLEEKK